MAPSNLLLNSLSVPGGNALLERCTPVDLPLRSILYQAELEPRYAYFLTSGFSSE